MPKAFVFDAFGTLVSPVPRDGAYQRLARDVGAAPAAFRRCALTSDASLESMAASLGVADVRQYRQLLDEELSSCALFEDVPEALAMLENRGIPYAVCSNLASGYGRKVKELLPRAAAYIFSFEAGLAKPEPEIYRKCCEALEHSAESMAFVGDTPRMDVDGPIAAGMRAALVDRVNGKDVASAVRLFLA